MYARDFPEASKEGPEAFDKMKGAPAYLKNGPAAFAHLQSQEATEKEFYFWWYQNNVDTRFPTAWKAIEDRIAHLPSFMPRIDLGEGAGWHYYPWWFVGIIKTASEGGTVMNGTKAHNTTADLTERVQTKGEGVSL